MAEQKQPYSPILVRTKVIKETTLNVFEEAENIVYGDREKTYGHPSINLTRIAAQWSLYLSQRYEGKISLSPEDVCWMMADLKKVRQMNQHKRDNIVDAMGYIGLVHRITESAQGDLFLNTAAPTPPKGGYKHEKVWIDEGANQAPIDKEAMQEHKQIHELQKEANVYGSQKRPAKEAPVCDMQMGCPHCEEDDLSGVFVDDIEGYDPANP